MLHASRIREFGPRFYVRKLLVFGKEFFHLCSVRSVYKGHQHLKPHCIQSSQVLVPAGTSKNQGHGVYVVFNNAYISTLKWLHRYSVALTNIG
jgi:hypothetical protein